MKAACTHSSLTQGDFQCWEGGSKTVARVLFFFSFFFDSSSSTFYTFNPRGWQQTKAVEKSAANRFCFRDHSFYFLYVSGAGSGEPLSRRQRLRLYFWVGSVWFMCFHVFLGYIFLLLLIIWPRPHPRYRIRYYWTLKTALFCLWAT